jgi:hypothetical protein
VAVGTLWRLSVGPVAATPCQSSLVVAINDFWRIWGCWRFLEELGGLLSVDLGFWRFGLSTVCGVDGD